MHTHPPPINACTHACMHTCMHACTHACTHAHTHTHTMWPKISMDPLSEYILQCIIIWTYSKQCRPRSEAAKCSIWYGSTLLATHPAVFLVKWTGSLALILLYTTTLTFANSVNPEPSDQDLHCLSFSFWIWMKTLYNVIWLADSQKRVWLFK